MRVLFLTFGGYAAAVDLVTLPVIERLSCKKYSPLVAASTIRGPLLEDVQEVLVRFWLGGTVDVYHTTVCGLARLVLRKSNMAILLVA